MASSSSWGQVSRVSGLDLASVTIGRLRGASWLGLAAVVALAAAYAVLAQGPGWNANAHYALVRALAEGTTTIDQTRYETGAWYSTGDISIHEGHVYASKAPGLAFATFPAYGVMKAAGQADPVEHPTGQLWFLTLCGVVLPAFVLLYLVRRLADELEPGHGTAAAVTLGLSDAGPPVLDASSSRTCSRRCSSSPCSPSSGTSGEARPGSRG